jgi:glycosyltransferase involved in cell wall biosynthesis
MGRKRFILLEEGGLINRTLLGSLVMDLIHALEKHGINNDFITSVRISPSIITKHHQLKETKRMIEHAIEGKVYLLARFPLITFGIRRVNTVLQQALLLLILLPDIFLRRTIVILARAHEAAETATGLKILYKKLIVFSDLEGEIVAEYKHKIEKEKGHSIHNKKMRRNIKYLDKVERKIILRSDWILCVSNAFKEHLLMKHRVKTAKLSVLPNGADSGKFYFDEKKRNEIRKGLKIEDKFVFIYSGNMNPWQMFPKMIDVFKIIKTVENNSHFLILTPFKKEAIRVINAKHLSEKDYTLLSVEHDLVPTYLSAADLAFLIREKHLLNKVSSPTKFSEYVMCGLPVIMTEEIGDYSEIMKTQDFGIVIRDREDEKEIINKFVTFRDKSDNINRNKISEWATSLFSKENQIPVLLEVYRKSLNTK